MYHVVCVDKYLVVTFNDVNFTFSASDWKKKNNVTLLLLLNPFPVCKLLCFTGTRECVLSPIKSPKKLNNIAGRMPISFKSDYSITNQKKRLNCK